MQQHVSNNNKCHSKNCLIMQLDKKQLRLGQESCAQLLSTNLNHLEPNWWLCGRRRRLKSLLVPKANRNSRLALLSTTLVAISFFALNLSQPVSLINGENQVTDQVRLQISQAERFRQAHQAARAPRYGIPQNQEPIVIGPAGPMPAPPGQVIVPGGTREQRVTQVVLPYDSFARNFSSQEPSVSYIIDSKRFVEAVSTRCLASTILENPSAVEPSFIIVRPTSEVRLNATIPTEFIRLAGYEAQKPTTIIIHGFTQSYPSTGWLRKVRALYEIHSLVPKHNLIIMDWGKASQGSYAQVAAMVSGMGSFLANFIMKLLDLGADRMSIHVIGHSLGAHLAGFAGKRIRPRLGRITALDPAGPCFGKIFSNSKQDRLSPDDAFEVDVYHYDDDFLGLPGQHGQFDVYVNGGSSQPGCTDNMNSMFQALLTMIFRRNRVLSESHTRSTEVSTMQLSQTGCQQVAYECRSYSAFKVGECGKCDDLNSQCFLMGFNFQYADMDTIPLRTSFPGKRLYISTGSNELYCLNHFQVLVKFELSPEVSSLVSAQRVNKWRLELELLGDLQKRVELSITNQLAPHVYSYLLLTEAQPVRFKAARLQVLSMDGSSLIPLGLSPNSAVKVNQIEVNFMSHVNANARRALSSRLCPVTGASLFDSSSSSSNSINVDSSDNAWLQFDECFPQAGPA